MRLQTENRDVTRSGIVESSEFKIKATAKAFGILSSGLYSDKILAIIRELSCNAYDSHVAAGKKDLPIEIKLPTSLNHEFYVKDCGTGLDHEGIVHLYTTYFESSKTDSNDFIGALGLGSKSPFSYVNNFTVESRYNGTKRLYVAIINEHGVPEINLQGEQQTDEQNGLTVSFAAKAEDRDKFLQAAKRALMYFNPVPNVIGGGTNFKPHAVKYVISGTNWKLREGNYETTSGARVIQGFVSYPIDRNILAQHGLSKLGIEILGLEVDLFVPIGQVEVAASREALSYNKHTITNLIRAVGVAEREMRDSIQKQFDSCKCLWDARLLHVKLGSWQSKTRHMYEELSSTKPFTYQGVEITDQFNLDLTNIKQTQIQIMRQANYGKKRISQSGSWDPSKAAKTFGFAVKNGMHVLVDDTFKSKGILGEHLDTKSAPENQEEKTVIVIKGVAKGIYDATEVADIIKQLGVVGYDVVSKLNFAPQKIKQYTYRARKNDEAVVWKGFPKNGGYRKNQLRRVFSRLCWDGKKIDLNTTDTTYYVEIDRFTIVNNKKKDQTYFDTMLECAQMLGILSNKIAVIGLTEKQVRAVKSNKNYVNLFAYVTEQFNDMNKTKQLTHRVVAERVLLTVGAGISKHIVEKWNEVGQRLVDGSFKDVIANIVSINDNSKACSSKKAEHINGLANIITPQFEVECDKLVEEIHKELTSVMSKHEMLEFTDWARVGHAKVDVIIDYVNFVAKK